MPLYHGFIDLKRIAVSEKLSPSAENQYLFTISTLIAGSQSTGGQ